MLVMVLGAEITGASAIVSGWAPGLPQWVVALVVVSLFAVINLWGVRQFGEFELWFAFIKLAAILAFLVIGVLLAPVLLHGTDPVGTSYLLVEGGFAPTGMACVDAGLLVVAFTFGVIEIDTLTSP